MICPYCDAQLADHTAQCPYCLANLSLSVNFDTPPEVPAAPDIPQMQDVTPPQPVQQNVQQPFQPNAPQAFPQNAQQPFQPNAPQAFPQNAQQPFQPNAPQAFPQNSQQPFQPNAPQSFQQNPQQPFQQPYQPNGPMPFQPPSSGGKKWVIPAVIGVLVCAGIAITAVLVIKNKDKDKNSSASSLLSSSESVAEKTTTKATTTQREAEITEAAGTDESSFEGTSAAIVPGTPPADDSQEALDAYYLPRGITMGMSPDEVAEVFARDYSVSVNSEPVKSTNGAGGDLYLYFFNTPPEGLGEYGAILNNTTVSIELFFDEDDELVQVDVYAGAVYNAESDDGLYGESLSDTLQSYNALQLGAKGFKEESIYEPYPFGEDEGNYHTHAFVNSDESRCLSISYYELDPDAHQYCAFYSYF